MTTYTYDGNGNLKTKTDADGYVTTYGYNGLDMVTSINYNGGKEVSYQYNKVGDLVKMVDWTGTTTFEVDLLNRITKTTDTKGNVVGYTHDATGNQTTEIIVITKRGKILCMLDLILMSVRVRG